MNDWFDAEQRVERAQQLSESQQWGEALAELEVALSINPNNAGWHAQRGYILEELGQTEDAADAYEHSLELEPGDRDVSVAFGVVLVLLGRHTRAVEVLSELARAYPDFEPAYCHRIQAYAELGLHDQAEQMFYLAQEMDDCCPHCFFHIGKSLMARGQTDRAVYCWERVLDLEPAYIGVNRRIGQAYRKKGQLEQAHEYFLRELREDPGNTDLLYELADLTLESGQVASAAAKFSQILELDPEHDRSRFALGQIRLSNGQPSEALECFEAIDIVGDDEPEFVDLDLQTGKALYQLRRFTEARARFEAAAEKNRSDPNLRMLSGNCLLADHKHAEAADWYRRVLAIDPNHAFAHQNLAVCLFHAGKYAAGVDHCVQALQAKPDYVLAMHNAAIAYLHLAKWRDARSMLRRALQHDPSNEALRLLARRIWRYRLRHYFHSLSSPLLNVLGYER